MFTHWWQMVILAAVLIIPAMPVTFGLSLYHEGGPDQLRLWLRLFGFLHVEYDVKLAGGRLTEDLIKRLPPGGPDAWIAAARRRLRQMDRFSPALRYLVSAVLIRRFTVAIELGTGDAALTGLTAGAIWSLFGGFKGLAPTMLHFAPGEPRLYLTPRFERTALRLRVRCIFTLRVGHIIVAGSKLLHVGIKGVSSWRVSTPFRG